MLSINKDKQHLIERLKQEHALWSYRQDAINDVPDDILIELVMIHLDSMTT